MSEPREPANARYSLIVRQFAGSVVEVTQRNWRIRTSLFAGSRDEACADCTQTTRADEGLRDRGQDLDEADRQVPFIENSTCADPLIFIVNLRSGLANDADSQIVVNIHTVRRRIALSRGVFLAHHPSADSSTKASTRPTRCAAARAGRTLSNQQTLPSQLPPPRSSSSVVSRGIPRPALDRPRSVARRQNHNGVMCTHWARYAEGARTSENICKSIQSTR